MRRRALVKRNIIGSHTKLYVGDPSRSLAMRTNLVVYKKSDLHYLW